MRETREFASADQCSDFIDFSENNSLQREYPQLHYLVSKYN